MKTGTITILGVATGLVAAGAWYTSASRAAGNAAIPRNTPLLPALQEQINDVASLAVTTADGTVTLERGEEGWTLAEKAGYPARADRVRTLLFELRDARVIEEKTADPARFTRLGLEAPDAEGSSARRIVILSNSGETLCDVLVGDRSSSQGGFAPGQPAPDAQTFVHPEGDGPALLVSGGFQADARANGWLDQELLDISAARFKAARVTHADGEAVEVARGDTAETGLRILGVPDGMEPKVPDATRAFTSALSRLRFDDVAPAEGIDWTASPMATAQFFTEEGLRIVAETVELLKTGDEFAEGTDPTLVTWARLRADVVDTSEIPGAPGDDAMGPEAPPADEGEETPDPTGNDRGALEAEAASLNAALEGWAFALPSWKSGPFRMRMDGLLQPIEEPETAPEPAAEAAPSGEDGGL
ncbi:MAG: DUF4340 domain-containing protein [Planctomycetota bacterium]|nr:DUF4340 domain-containing protein [Planctomycetota bacterium]